LDYQSDMKRLTFLFISVLMAACSQSETVVPAGPPQLPPPGGSPNLFKEYSVEGDSVLSKSWARNFDMSGVSFNQKQTCTLVTRRHVVMAKHYQRGIGSRVIFHDRNGKRLERILTARKAVIGDVAVGLLNADVPAGYKVYALPAPREDFSNLIGRTAAVTDQNRRLFFHRIGMVTPTYVSFRHEEPKRHGWGKKLVSGDSGNPSFLISGNELVLIETHTGGGPGVGPFYGSRGLQEKLQIAINELAPGYSLRKKNL
jgi:hypothetical protein